MRLALDPHVPHRDALLDLDRMRTRLDRLLGTRGDLGINHLEHVRVKYRVGRGLGLLLRVHTARRSFLVSARSFSPAAAFSNYERALTSAPDAVAGLPAVSFAPELDTVFWTYPHDRRIGSLELLCGPSAALDRLLSAHAVPAVVAYVPEKAATARCVDEHGTPTAYVKVYAGDPEPRFELLRMLHAALRGTPLRVPAPLGYDRAHAAIALAAVTGEPLQVRHGRGDPAAMRAFGAALATLHSVPPPRGLPSITPPAGREVAESAQLIATVRPDVARAAHALAAELDDGFVAGGDQVWLHGDPHCKNVLRDHAAIGLIDFDQAGRGPAASDLGSVLARLRYLRVLGAIPAAAEQMLGASLLDGYASVRELPQPHALNWHTAASLLTERAMRAVTRLNEEGLTHLPEIIESGRSTWPSAVRRPAAVTRRPSRARPTLMLYCQHAVGLGHLARSLALAGSLAERFRVVLLSGGSLPQDLTIPAGVELVKLPPLMFGDDGALCSPDRRRSVERVKAIRTRMLTEAVREHRPSVVLVELFPFGRRAFTGEITAMLEAARRPGPRAPMIASSVRDILVDRGDKQSAYDERACCVANAYFDAILVHSDPRFARLEESFRPRTPLRVPVHYTGFVTAAPAARSGAPRAGRIVVSAGGGRVGELLLRTAIVTQRALWPDLGVPMRLIAGPFLPADAWRRVRSEVKAVPGIELRRSVGDLSAELRAAAVSVSQCGYNTALELLQARVPALVVPYLAPGEDEQLRRATRLAALGALRMLDPRTLDGRALAEQIVELHGSVVAAAGLDLDGARRTTEMLWELTLERVSGAKEPVSA
jgi:predicted glycosyltransferase/Ser/Thr protein kinase RdoA (MazF antagonist)